MSVITVAELRSFYGFTEGEVSNADLTQILGFVTTQIEMDGADGAEDDVTKLLELLLFGCYFYSKRNPAQFLRRGITSWDIGRLKITFDISNTRLMGSDFCASYKDIVAKYFGGSGTTAFAFTNTGTGLWQSTQRDGPLYIRVGDKA